MLLCAYHAFFFRFHQRNRVPRPRETIVKLECRVCMSVCYMYVCFGPLSYVVPRNSWEPVGALKHHWKTACVTSNVYRNYRLETAVFDEKAGRYVY